MKISEKVKQMWSGNHFQLSMSCDLDLWTPKSIGVILVAMSICRDVALSTTRDRDIARWHKSATIIFYVANTFQDNISGMHK